jgi:5'-nucleotidase
MHRKNIQKEEIITRVSDKFSWEKATRSIWGDKLPEDKVERRRPLIWLVSEAGDMIGKGLYLVNDTGNSLDYVWSGKSVDGDGYYSKGDRFRYTNVKDKEAVMVKQFRGAEVVLRIGSKSLGSLVFSVPHSSGLRISCWGKYIRTGLAWEGERVSPLKTLYIDMDNVLVDFKSGINRLTNEEKAQYEDRLDEVPGIFSKMDPMPDAIEAFETLAWKFDTYILSTSPWNNPLAWMEKLNWVKEHLGYVAHKRLILTHHKNLNRGDFLIDDRPNNGAGEFQGELISFDPKKANEWGRVTSYLEKKA